MNNFYTVVLNFYKLGNNKKPIFDFIGIFNDHSCYYFQLILLFLFFIFKYQFFYIQISVFYIQISVFLYLNISLFFFKYQFKNFFLNLNIPFSYISMFSFLVRLLAVFL